jgi:putative DNA primase/helicase
VLDVDGEEGKATLAGLQSRHGALPPTVTSLTGSGGWHLFFGLPSGRTVRNSVRRLGLGLDTRGLGGYVIAPPSIHPSGQAYGFAEGFTPWSAPLAVAPAWLLDLLDPPTAPQAATTTRAAPGGGTDAYARVALEGELMRLAEAVEGERNHTLNRAAYALGQLVAAGRLVRKAVEAALGSVALASGLDPGEANRTIVSGLEAGMASPREISHA